MRPKSCLWGAPYPHSPMGIGTPPPQTCQVSADPSLMRVCVTCFLFLFSLEHDYTPTVAYPTSGSPDLRGNSVDNVEEEFDPYKRDSVDVGQSARLLGSSSDRTAQE